MKVTKVHVLINRDKDSKVKAFCSITLDDELVVNNLVVMVHDERGYYYVNFPSKLKNNTKRIPIVEPLSKVLFKSIEDAILDEYERLLNEDLTKTGA